MRIGYDAKRIVKNGTGLGSYGRTLVNALSAQEDGDMDLWLYAPDSGKESLRGQVVLRPNVRFVYPERPLSGIKAAFWRSKGIIHDLQRDRIDLFHGLSGELPFGIRKSGIKSVVTIHDLIFLRHPEYYHWIDTKIYAWKFRMTCKEADRIIAISECTKNDILHYSDFPAEKIDVVYQSCGTRFTVRSSDMQKALVRQKYGLPQRYILNVGTIERRKNALLAVKALPLLPDDLHLVIVGRQTAYVQDILRFVEKANLTHRVHLLSGVPNDDLYAIYQQADCFVYPSRYEGFGIPIIEAIQSGLPVVGCVGSCLEEAGGPDCLYVDPDRPEEMAEAIRQMLPGAAFREKRISMSREYVHRFENTDIAHQMIAEYKAILRG